MNAELAIRPILDAISFAGRAHATQLRKDGRTPYASHPFRVAMIVRQVFGVDDPAVLQAAALHDTIEDTTTDRDDLEEHFGPVVASWVALLSKDGRMPEIEREAAFRSQLAAAPWQVQIVKLADLLDNLLDSSHLDAKGQARAVTKAAGYFAVLNHADARVQAARAIVAETLAVRQS